MPADTFDCPTDLVVGDEIELDNQFGLTKYRVADEHPQGWGSNTVRLVNISNPFDYYLNYDGAPIMHVTWRRLNPVTPLVVVEVPTPPKGQYCARPNCPEPYQEYAAPNMPDGRFCCFSCRADGYGTTWATHLFAKDE